MIIFAFMNLHYTSLWLLLCLLQLKVAFCQDSIYTTSSILANVRIRDNDPDFVVYRIPADDYEKNYFLNKKFVNRIVYKRGFIEDITHYTNGDYKSVYSFVDSNGIVYKENTNYDPSANLPFTNGIKLSRFKNDKYYSRTYGEFNHFYINDPEKRFYNSKEVIFTGVNFGYMKLINQHDRLKVYIVTNKHLKNVSNNINSADQLTAYPTTFLKGKRMRPETRAAAVSYKKLDQMSWINPDDKDYSLPPGKIPAIISLLEYEIKEGIGLTFIVEKFSKPEKAISGYWVAFDFASKKILLLDYIYFNKVRLQLSNFIGWDGYWEAGALAAGVLEPISFQYYLDLEKKGKFELEQGN